MWCRALGVRTLSAEELSRDVERLAADNNALLTVQKLLGHDGRKATKEVALAIDNDLCDSGQRAPSSQSIVASRRRLPARPSAPRKFPSILCLEANIQPAVAAAAPGSTHNRLETRHRKDR